MGIYLLLLFSPLPSLHGGLAALPSPTALPTQEQVDHPLTRHACHTKMAQQCRG